MNQSEAQELEGVLSHRSPHGEIAVITQPDGAHLWRLHQLLRRTGNQQRTPMAAIYWDAAIAALHVGALPCSAGERIPGYAMI